jgi:hypothetical protein
MMLKTLLIGGFSNHKSKSNNVIFAKMASPEIKNENLILLGRRILCFINS